MNPFLFNAFLIALLLLYFSYQLRNMAQDNKKPTQEELDQQNFDPNNLIVNMGGRQVPFSSINKPHHVVIQPRDNKPNVDPASFPDVEPEAKAREAKLEAEAAEKKNA